MNELIPKIIPFIAFALSTSITPGPNNMLLAIAGANNSFWRAMPQLLGVATGFGMVLIASAVGLGTLFASQPWLHQILKAASFLYLLYLAYKVLQLTPSDPGRRDVLSYWEAAGFQFINPKVWFMALTAITAFTLAGNSYMLSATAVILAFILIYLPCGALWIGFGAALRVMIQKEKIAKSVNIALAVLLVVAAISSL